MDWEQKQEQKIQNRIKYKSKKEHNRFYRSKYDDDDSHLYHKFKKIKSNRMKDDDE